VLSFRLAHHPVLARGVAVLALADYVFAALQVVLALAKKNNGKCLKRRGGPPLRFF